MPKHFFQKGNTYGKGRPKGCQNKVNTDFKEAFMIVFERMGGWKGLYRWGIENPNIFYPLIAKMVPQKSMIDLDFRLSHEDWVRKIAEFHRNKLSEDEENVAISGCEDKEAVAISGCEHKEAAGTSGQAGLTINECNSESVEIVAKEDTCKSG